MASETDSNVVCPDCGKRLGKFRDAFCSYCRAPLDERPEAADVEDEPYEIDPMLTAPATSSTEDSMGLIDAFVLPFEKLFRSRDTILREAYSEALASVKDFDPSSMSYLELREVYQTYIKDATTSYPGGVNACLDRYDRGQVLLNRLVYLWLAVWFTFVPTTFALLIAYYVDGPNVPQRILLFVGLWVVFFLPGFILGILVQQALIGPVLNIACQLLGLGAFTASDNAIDTPPGEDNSTSHETETGN